MLLNFDEDAHEYFWEGRHVPSVTTVIGEWRKVDVWGTPYYINVFNGSCVPAGKFEAKRDWGKAVDKMVNLYLLGRLDESVLHESLKHPLDELKAWLHLLKPEITSVQERLYSKKLRYAGTSDIICVIKKWPCIVDVKTGGYDMAGPQTAAYENAHREKMGRALAKHKRYVLYLPPEGPFKFIEFADYLADFGFFQSRLFQYRFLNRR